MAMTRKQKQDLAYAVLDLVASRLVPACSEADAYYAELEGLDPAEAAQTLANWLHHLPTGGNWPTDLPLPTRSEWRQ